MQNKNYLFTASLLIFLTLVNFTACSNSRNKQTGVKNNNRNTHNSVGNNNPSSANNNLSPSQKSFAGIYVASRWQKPIDDYVLQNPDVDGVFLRMFWEPMELEQGKYDWSHLDSEAKRIIAAGKKISIGVMAGSRTPDWVYKLGTPGLEFTEIPQSGKSKMVINFKIPIPWNEKYLNAFTNFIKAMATHLKTDKQVYNAVSIVKITGINENTVEIRLPAQKNVSNEKATSTDAPAIWKKAGYKPQLVLNCWKQIIDCFAENFPDKPISMAIISGNRGFPPINNSGDIVDRKQSHDITEDMIADGMKRYKERFVVQFNALGAREQSLKLVVEAAGKGALTGYQLEQVKVEHPPCLENNSPCDENMFQSILDLGISKGALFLEIFPKNVKAYPIAIKMRRRNLFQTNKSKT